MKTLLSFVIPCYRSEFTIESVIDEIIKTISQREAYDYEIICVNDNSPDGVLDILKKLAENDPKIKIINFARNSGKHAAVLAGYSYANGDYIVNLDDDFQCPVDNLWLLLEPVEMNECDCAVAKYTRKKQSAWKNIGSNINMIMAQVMLDKPPGLRFENFSIMKRFVVREMMKYDKPYPYLEGLLFRVTKKIATVPMEQRERGDDRQTGFTFYKSVSLWLNGFTTFSVKPLRISTILGFLSALLGFMLGIVMIIKRLMNPDMPAGYTSLIAVQLFIGGVIMIILGLIGEYIGRIYICLNNTPQYVIKETINVSEKNN